MWRVFLGAGLSILDLTSDIYVCYLYSTTEGMEMFASLTMAMLVVSLNLQVFMTVFQNYQRGLVAVLTEILFILIGIKPGVDAYRVAMGHEKSEGALVDPLYELAATKILEIISESIPGCLIQTYAFLTSGETELQWSAPLLSIIVSAATTGFVSSQITYDYDTDPENRKHKANFYGMIPDDARGRSVVFLLMIVNSGCMLLNKCLSFSLLFMVRPKLVFQYCAFDMGMYILQKMARGDFFYWIDIGGVLVYAFSLVERVIVKVIVDFTCMFHMRHPFELGGLYWSINVVLSHIATLVGCILYLDAGEDGRNRSTSYGDGVLQNLIIAISGTWFVTFILIMFKTKQEYRSTFWSPTTAPQYIAKGFHSAESDEVKANQVFGVNGKMWTGIRAEVKIWTQLNFRRWMRESPDWLTEALIASIPPDMIPESSSWRQGGIQRPSKVGEVNGLLKREGEGGGETCRNGSIFQKKNEWDESWGEESGERESGGESGGDRRRSSGGKRGRFGGKIWPESERRPSVG